MHLIKILSSFIVLLSFSVNANEAKNWLNKEFRISNKDIKSISIKTQRFDKILEQNNFIEFDFLNIDIEGHELEVLQSLNFKKFKIDVICVEILDYDKTSNLRKKKLINTVVKNYRFVVLFLCFGIYDSKSWSCKSQKKPSSFA